MYYYNGAGIGAGDFNNDGKIDLYFGANQGVDQFYLNVSEGGIRFENITNAAKLGDNSDWTTGISVVDINQDGWNDIYVCQVGGYKSFEGSNKLYINQGVENGIPVFKEMSKAYGLDFSGLSTHDAFFYLDNYGYLDVYLLNHSVHGSESYADASIRLEKDDLSGDRLYRNDSGVFVDITTSAGIYSSHIGYGLGIDIGDIDKNGFSDVYITNDFHENDYLYLNNGDGTFKEVIKQTTGHTSQFSMGVTVSDLNNDSWLDIMTLDMMPEDEEVRLSSVDVDPFDIYNFKKSYGYHAQLPRNNLQLHQGLDKNGRPFFFEIGVMAGVDATDWSWSVIPGDYDNDGDKDIFVSNGIVRRPNDLDYLKYLSNPLIQQNASDNELMRQMPSGLVSNVLLEQVEGLGFKAGEQKWLASNPSASTGAISVDLDNDGDLDIITNNINQPAGILENTSEGHHYIKVSLKDKNGLDAIGAKLTVFIKDVTQFEELQSTQGFISSYIGPLHFGMADNNHVDSMHVQWPDGSTSKLKSIASNQTIVIRYPSGISNHIVRSNLEINRPFARIDTIPFVHHEDQFDDIGVQKLMPWLLSKEGPASAFGDVNGDGLEDLFIGGAHGQAGVFLIANSDGGFERKTIPDFERHKDYEDVAAIFVDIDGDLDLDLYVGSGGHRERDGSLLLIDRIYKNDGNGSFTYDRRALMMTSYNTSVVKAGDVDDDGDQDLLVGYRVFSNRYGLKPQMNILINDGTGNFTIGPFPKLREEGMITDMAWEDIDGDSDLDIVVVGEWMPITTLIKKEGNYKIEELPNSTGLWQSILVYDVDADGDVDFILGNYGDNNVLAQADGAGMLLCDYDDNGVVDPILYYVENGQKYPLNGKDALAGQMVKIKSDFQDYKSFAKKDLDEIFDVTKMNGATQIKIDEMSSVWLERKIDGTYDHHILPREAQYAPVRALALVDVNMDGIQDLLLGGNRIAVSPSLGAADASKGMVLYGDGLKGFEYRNHGSNLEIDGIITEWHIDRRKDRVIGLRNDASSLVLDAH